MLDAQFPRRLIRAAHGFSSTYGRVRLTVAVRNINSGIAVPHWQLPPNATNLAREFCPRHSVLVAV